MTGLYPYKIGMQRGNISPFRPYGLPTDIKILPQYLKEKGYSTHLLGKIVDTVGVPKSLFYFLFSLLSISTVSRPIGLVLVPESNHTMII